MSITIWLGQVITIIVLVGGAFVAGMVVGDSHKGEDVRHEFVHQNAE